MNKAAEEEQRRQEAEKKRKQELVSKTIVGQISCS